MNPFKNPSFIRVGYDEETGFFIEIVPEGGFDIVLTCGTAATAATILRVNEVEHFDFKDSIMNNSDAYGAFASGARMVGFAF